MCLLALLWRATEDAPLIVAANREEQYARGGTPPQVVRDTESFIAGLDPQAGGTWLGLNRHGVMVAVTNGRPSESPKQLRSRGLLVRDLLSCTSAAEASKLGAHELGTNRYAPCNLICGDYEDLFVLHAHTWLQVLPLPTGIHVVGRGNVNSTAEPRVAHALAWLGSLKLPTSGMWLQELKKLCGDPRSEGGPAMCVKGKEGGTVSSTLIALRRPLTRSTYVHAQGPPDRTPYQDYSHLLRELR
jgi:uncharacterized protein with NRDE domain